MWHRADRGNIVGMNGVVVVLQRRWLSAVAGGGKRPWWRFGGRHGDGELP